MLASVMALYAGEPYKNNLTEEFDYYSIVGNQTPIDLNVTQIGLEVTIIPNKYTKNETFSIIFFNREKETITITDTVYTGGGGSSSSRTKIVYKNSTKNIPIYTDVEVPGENIETIITETTETGYKLWHIILVAIATLLIALILLYLFRGEDDNFYKN